MKTILRFTSRLMFASGLLAAAPARADFSPPFSLTPPLAGTFMNAPAPSFFGDWTLSLGMGENWTVSTAGEPASLYLTTIDHSIAPGPTEMRFEVDVPSTGTIAFDFIAAYGLFTPQIAFIVNGLDVQTNPVSGSASIPVLAGDTFGFRLKATGPGSSMTDQAAITVTNFVPEPGAAGLVGAGLLLGLAGRWWRNRIPPRQRKP